jgi:diguanylate cyclase (GGDEF)-like protein
MNASSAASLTMESSTPELTDIDAMVLAFNALEQGVAVTDTNSVVLTCNAAWRRWHQSLFGTSAGPGTCMRELATPGDGHERDRYKRYLSHQEYADGTWLRMTVPDAQHVRVRFWREEAGRTVAVIEDETENRSRELEFRDSAARFRDFAESSGDWFWELDEALHYRVCTGAGRDGGGSEDVTGQGFIARLQETAVNSREVETISRSMAAREAFREIEVRLLDTDGQERLTSLSGVPFAGDDGTFQGYRGSARNVIQSNGLASRLAYQASHDDLTGLANRRALEARITELLAEGLVGKHGHALCFLDLDQFKVVNDTCGRGAGDTLLNHLAKLLRDGLRGADTVARLGGDEFAVLLRDCEPTQAEGIAEKMRKAIAKRPFTWEGQQFRVTASVGVAPLSSSSMKNAGDVLQAADSACFAAKERGRNRVKLYALDDSTLNLRQGEMHWVARIHSTLAENRFELQVQPIAPAAGDDPDHLHFEALLRMNGRDGRQFSPGAFLPAAERYNLAIQIDSWVLAESLDWLHRSPLFLDHLHTLSMNLSGQSLGEPSFLSHVKERLRAHPDAARKLCFEVTETAAISNLDRAQEFIAAMREFGCTFALDDFGSGLSSFAYLRTLDVDYLKIDGVFVKDCHEDPIHKAMVRSINEVGHVMGKKTIAEFVENEDIRATLVEIGVDYVQGYAIGKPVPFADVV